MYGLFINSSKFGNIYFLNKKKDLFSVFKKNYFNVENFFNIDEKVYGQFISNEVNFFSKKNSFIVKSGESSKNINIVEENINYLIKKKFFKNTNIFSIGGGVVGDMTGFVSSIYYRGINLFHVPTTVLSQSDSSIGGKNAVNSSFGKNLIGTIYQPKKIFVCLEFLETLDNYYYKMGISEILKISLIFDKKFFFYIKKNLGKILIKKLYILKYILKTSILYKFKTIKKDPLDKGYRFCLNLGHTFAHAYESLKKYSLNHGEAVLIGLVFASFLSFYIKKMDIYELSEIIKLIKKIYPNVIKDIVRTDLMKFLDFIKFDKKKVSEKKIKFVILNHIGIISYKEIKISYLINFFSYLNSELVNWE